MSPVRDLGVICVHVFCTFFWAHVFAHKYQFIVISLVADILGINWETH